MMSWLQWVAAALVVVVFGVLLGFGVLLPMRWCTQLSARRKRRRSRSANRAVWRAGGTVHRG
jgi:hypothetical protein